MTPEPCAGGQCRSSGDVMRLGGSYRGVRKVCRGDRGLNRRLRWGIKTKAKINTKNQTKIETRDAREDETKNETRSEDPI